MPPQHVALNLEIPLPQKMATFTLSASLIFSLLLLTIMI